MPNSKRKSKPNPPNDGTTLISVKDAATALSVHVGTLLRWCRATWPDTKWSYRSEISGRSACLLKEQYHIPQQARKQGERKVEKVERTPVEESYKSDLERATRELKKARQVEGQEHRLDTTIRELVPAIKPVPFAFKASKRMAEEAEVGLMIGDWHVGEQTSWNETEGFGEYNLDVAKARLQALRERFGNHIENHRRTYRIDRVHILGLGDWVSGEIHDELVRTNEFDAPEAALQAGNLFASFTASLAAQFRECQVHFLKYGNHDRIDRKPPAKRGSLRSWGHIVASVSRQQLSGQPGVTFNTTDAFTMVAKVANTRFLLLHGDGIKMHNRTPFYGIESRFAEEKVKRAGTPQDFDIMVLGHFHTPCKRHGKWLLNGSLTGTTEFDHKCGRHGGPSQTAFLVSPKHKPPFDEITFDL